ncbi:FAD/NAD(P)-binding protein [Streptomyces sp. NPDC015661]|uniref:FAD/NAD(P)-binding protein n=1 Tax=Streptomyces sp. NPDC015661 TaxID=3364961 RepID=UPI0037020536
MTNFRGGCQPRTLVVIGTGPRGISVLERMAARLADSDPEQEIRIYAVDDVEVGVGRVWRTDQDDWYTMNTVAGQITMYSGVPDDGPWRPGAGPALDEWSRATAGERPLGPDDYASRQTYGRYLRTVFRTVRDSLPAHVDLVGMNSRVTRLERRPVGGWLVELDQAPFLVAADQVLLATGHPVNEPDVFEQRMLDFAGRHEGVRYLAGDSAADMPLDTATVPAGSTVAVKGLGLSFYDVMLALTVGRGGEFKRGDDETLTYLPSGQEPRIVAGSRSGLPIPARGVNQKAPDHTYRPLFLTKEAVQEARERRQERDGHRQLSFASDVLPLLMRELDHVYGQVHAASGDHGEPAALDLDALARPFRGEDFDSPEDFRRRLLTVMRADLREAHRGNARGPLKAALDVLRDTRNVVREAVDYGGLLPASHEEEFDRAFLPGNALLSAGPPAERVEQLVALIEEGVVEIAGPGTVFDTDEEAGLFRIASPSVEGSARRATALVDARIPTPDLRRDTSALTRTLLASGVISEYLRTGPDGGGARATGGLNVTRSPFRVIAADGTAHDDLYALGIPTEHTRWFTQVGSGKPGLNTLFRQDADAIAEAMLCPVGQEPSGGTV